MYQKHAELYSTLSPAEAHAVWTSLQVVGQIPMQPPPDLTGEELAVRVSHLSHAEVVLSMARATAPVAVSAVEKLIARPIYHAARGESGLVPDTDVAGRPLQAPVSQRRGEVPRMEIVRPGIGITRAVGTYKYQHDPRIVVHVTPNPKRPGSAAHERYKLWTVGRTIDEHLASGITRADVRWDEKQGFVRAVTPEFWDAARQCEIVRAAPVAVDEEDAA